MPYMPWAWPGAMQRIQCARRDLRDRPPPVRARHWPVPGGATGVERAGRAGGGSGAGGPARLRGQRGISARSGCSRRRPSCEPRRPPRASPPSPTRCMVPSASPRNTCWGCSRADCTNGAPRRARSRAALRGWAARCWPSRLRRCSTLPARVWSPSGRQWPWRAEMGRRTARAAGRRTDRRAGRHRSRADGGDAAGRHGAEVIRIERETPVDLGVSKPLRYNLTLRNRTSIALDLKQPASVERVLQLVAGADALIEGFRPGVTERLGLGPDVWPGAQSPACLRPHHGLGAGGAARPGGGVTTSTTSR